MKKIVFIFSLFLVVGSVVFAKDNYIRIEEKISQCQRELGVSIKINSTGIRDVTTQARLMANMTPRQLDMYDGGRPWYIVEMKACTLSGSARIAEFERLINRARDQRSFVSRHLDGDAVDIAPSTSDVRRWLESNGISVTDETEAGIQAWHLQLR